MKEKRIRISVITPVLNGERFIEKAIKSVLEQKYERVEHIVIDGGSEDRTIQIVKKYPSIKLVVREGSSQAEALNIGIKAAKGDLITSLNADDYFEKGAFKVVNKTFIKYPKINFVLGKCNEVDERGRLHFTQEKPASNFFQLRQHWFFPMPMNAASYFYRKKIHQRIGFYNTQNEFDNILDYEFLLRVGKVYKFFFIDKVLGNFRLYEGTKTYNNIRNYNISLYYNISKKFFGSYFNPLYYFFQLSYRIYLIKNSLMNFVMNFKIKSLVRSVTCTILAPSIVILLKFRERDLLTKYLDFVLSKIIQFSEIKPRFGKYLTKSLLEYTRPFPIGGGKQAEIHAVLCHEDIPQYILSLKSLLYFSHLQIQVVVHDDGSLDKKDIEALHKHFPGIQILEYSFSTQNILKLLNKFPDLRKERLGYRWNRFHILIMLDVPFFAKSKKIVYLDSDILFYAKPHQLLNWILNSIDPNEMLYMHDADDAYSLSEEMIKIFYKKNLIHKFNSGLRCYWKKRIQYAQLDRFLRLLGDLNDRLYWRDQTYAMLDALMRYKRIKQFNKSYVASFTPSVNKKVTCIHYFSPVRHKLYSEGIWLLTYKMSSIFFKK